LGSFSNKWKGRVYGREANMLGMMSDVDKGKSFFRCIIEKEKG